MLKIFNTLTGKKEVFKPIFYKKINMYVCGITVYDLCHIGHGRTFVCFDIIVRYLRYLGYEVQYIRNITDIDDKIIALSNKNKESITTFTRRMISYMHNDFFKLNLLSPDQEPRATQHISCMIDMISDLLNLKHAYISKNGDVMFSITSDINYGILSKQFIKNLQITNRIKDNQSQKNHIFDFVLWKIAKKNEPYWVSPWGNGRPGWHIECSAMSKMILGDSFDIHGGGSDLLFPHHENEIAQSTCVNRVKYVNYWLHTGIVIIKNKKMSKSLGNIDTLQDVLKNYHAEVIRYLLISTHYRHPLYYSKNSLKHAEISLLILYRALRGTNFKKIIDNNLSIALDFKNAMNDDFNTPKVLSIFLKVAHK
ncbi:MAG TPA: cysteine--tRNA ligase, partial [Buchnera sp. (in: enterobacteria)]|nr:cysteine--tRNA ligase [Buchnera sp. (in: enterobacteria)]